MDENFHVYLSHVLDDQDGWILVGLLKKAFPN
jgi:hypothetical protein